MIMTELALEHQRADYGNARCTNNLRSAIQRAGIPFLPSSTHASRYAKSEN